MTFTATVQTFRFGSRRYGNTLYGGLSPRTIVPTRDSSGIVFLTANDRYQVISCSYGGDGSTPPEFRYWYANTPGWAEDLNNDSFFPEWYSKDEDGTITKGTLELAFQPARNNTEMFVQNVTVEFVPRPATLTNESFDSDVTVGFSCHVEAQGVADYSRSTGVRTTGMVVSNTETFSELASAQDGGIWPNIRTVTFPCRIQQRVQSARVVLTDIQLCEILSVTLMGESAVPARDR